jgi:hypothetical protein
VGDRLIYGGRYDSIKQKGENTVYIFIVIEPLMQACPILYSINMFFSII